MVQRQLLVHVSAFWSGFIIAESYLLKRGASIDNLISPTRLAVESSFVNNGMWRAVESPLVQFNQARWMQPVADEGEGQRADTSEVGLDIDPARALEKKAQATAEEAVSATQPPATPSPEMKKSMEEVHHSAAELTGLDIDKPGDIETVAFAFCVNTSITLALVVLFVLLRKKFPLMYSSNAIEGISPSTADFHDALGWFRASYSLPIETIADSIGLDNALLIEFCNVCMRILGIISIPLVMLCPVHYYYGGGSISHNSIRVFSMANVKNGHPWLYYVHAVVVNFVTFVVVRVLHNSMRTFMQLRVSWLKRLPSPRCTTVLVEGIPDAWRSDAKLKEFFAKVFKAEAIVEARMVKNAPHLYSLFNEQATYKEKLEEAESRWYAEKQLPNRRPTTRDGMWCGSLKDAIDHYEGKLEEIKPLVAEERARTHEAAQRVGGVNTQCAFVTFKHRRKAEMAKELSIGFHKQDWVISTPPPASDIRWADLKSSSHTRDLSTAVGFTLVAALYIGFIPLCILGTQLAKTVHMGPLQPVWASFAPGMSLIVILSFLPTVMLLIFRLFFYLKADAYAQQKLQNWYFYFMVFFVILVTAICESLIATVASVVRRPGRMFSYLSMYLPGATKFYIDFMMMQWVTHALNFTRYINVIKFLFLRWFYTVEDAKKMSEPEDQDYYGIGSRSARFTINLAIGIIFSTLSPLIAVLTFINFFFCRIFYGYMIVYAEVKKPDLGGLFFVSQLRHVLVGTWIYNATMIGVFCFRASSKAPMLLAVPSLVYTLYTLQQFHLGYQWETLPFEELGRGKEIGVVDDGMQYIQPEFEEEIQESHLL